MSKAIILDLETKRRFQEVGGDKKKLGVSVVGIYDYRRDIFEIYLEKDFSSLFTVLESASVIVGFNIKKFDFPVLAPYYLGDIRQLPVLDLIEDIEKHLGFRVALDILARETLGVKKTGHGLQAIDFFKYGEWDKLKKYCLSDVRITRDLYEFGKKEGKVFIKDVHGRREIPVQWREVLTNKNIPLTLPI